MTTREREVARHVWSAVNEIYRSWGSTAPRLECDDYVVAVYHGARRFGELALQWRGALGGEPVPVGPLRELLDRAAAYDDGAMALYALGVVVGPRLLVSVRDARGEVLDEALVGLLDRTADVVVEVIRSIQATLARAPVEASEQWQRDARSLAEALDAQGMAESLGPIG